MNRPRVQEQGELFTSEVPHGKPQNTGSSSSAKQIVPDGRTECSPSWLKKIPQMPLEKYQDRIRRQLGETD